MSFSMVLYDSNGWYAGSATRPTLVACEASGMIHNQ